VNRNDIRAALLALPLNKPAVVGGIDVLRSSLGWSVNGQGTVALDSAVTVLETLRRIRG